MYLEPAANASEFPGHFVKVPTGVVPTGLSRPGDTRLASPPSAPRYVAVRTGPVAVSLPPDSLEEGSVDGEQRSGSRLGSRFAFGVWFTLWIRGLRFQVCCRKEAEARVWSSF